MSKVYKIRQKSTGLFHSGRKYGSRTWEQDGKVFFNRQSLSSSGVYRSFRHKQDPDVECVEFTLVESLAFPPGWVRSN